MLESIIICLFIVCLLTCVIMNFSIVYALLAGWMLFSFYAMKKGNTLKEVLKMSFSGVLVVKNVLILFILIGMVTAVWRASGTIPVIIYYSAQFILPSAFFLLVFLLNCMVSVLTGTAFGTAATVGVICMTISNAMGLNAVITGGAVLSGIFFGDRCSPMSTSALLVCTLTKTDIFTNIKLMVKTALIPFIISCLAYLLLGLTVQGAAPESGVRSLLAEHFNLHPAALMPALFILVLSCFKINVKVTIAVSILTACVLCVFIQKTPPAELVRLLMTGYSSADPELSAIMNGGGITSMLKVSAIVFISSSYAGIFDHTDLLNGIKKEIRSLSERISPFGSILFTSVAAAMFSCNQSLCIMLTHQLCKEIEPDSQKLAIDLENTAVVTAPLIPWSIAGAVPIAAISAPGSCLFAAFFLYTVPLWNFLYHSKGFQRITDSVFFHGLRNK